MFKVVAVVSRTCLKAPSSQGLAPPGRAMKSVIKLMVIWSSQGSLRIENEGTKTRKSDMTLL